MSDPRIEWSRDEARKCMTLLLPEAVPRGSEPTALYWRVVAPDGTVRTFWGACSGDSAACKRQMEAWRARFPDAKEIVPPLSLPHP